MLADFMMAISEKPIAKLAVADDFYTWYAEYKSTWEVIDVHTRP